MSAEQAAFMSGCVAFGVVVLIAVFSAFQRTVEAVLGIRGDVLAIDVPFSVALECISAGCVHYLAYYSTLRAYNQVSSTVITPLLQFSAILLLPIHSVVALWKGTDTIRPLHAIAVVLILVGGVLPISNGHLKAVLSAEFWVQPAVKACLLGELLVASYNLALHELTFSQRQSTLGVFVWSRVGNFATCLTLFLATPRLRKELWGLAHVSKRYLAICMTGQFVSVSGLLVVSFSYARFYEPAVVNAAEGGLQQLFNLALAALLAQLSQVEGMPLWVKNLGRPLTHIPVKLFSLVFIGMGLALTAV
jgi:hypothetical protein